MAGILMGGMCLAPSNNTILYGSTCNDFLVYIGSNSQNIAIGVSNSTPLMTIAGSTGNVGFAGNVTFNNPLNMTGIKVTQLTSAISQNMTAQISSFPGFTQKQSGAVQIVVNGPGNSNNIIQLMNSNNNEYMRVASNGFIGINNTNPQFNLDVGGSVNVSSNFTVLNTGYFSNVCVSSNLYIASSSSSIFTGLTIENQSHAVNNMAELCLSVNSNYSTYLVTVPNVIGNVFGINMTGSNYIPINVYNCCNSNSVITHNFTGTVNNSGSVIVANNASSQLLLQNNLGAGNSCGIKFATYPNQTSMSTLQAIDDFTGGSHLTMSTGTGVGGNNLSERVRITDVGYVGIGTSNPQYTLDVAGSVNVSSNMTVNGDVNMTGNLTIYGGTPLFYPPTALSSMSQTINNISYTITTSGNQYNKTSIYTIFSPTPGGPGFLTGWGGSGGVWNGYQNGTSLPTKGSAITINANLIGGGFIMALNPGVAMTGYTIQIYYTNTLNYYIYGSFDRINWVSQLENKLVTLNGNQQYTFPFQVANQTPFPYYAVIFVQVSLGGDFGLNNFSFINASYVGIGKTPTCALDVNGSVQYSSQLISSVATGTSPLSVASTTLVTNLNAQYLNGQLGSYYTNAANLTGTATSVTVPAGNISGAIPVASGGTGVTTSTGTGNNVLSASPILSGNVGIGTSTPAYPLDVNGSARVSSQLISSVATGTSPLSVASSTLVTNLNAQYLNGQLGSYYTNAANLTGTATSVTVPAGNISGAIPVASGGTGVTTSTGTGNNVLSASPILTGTVNTLNLTTTGLITNSTLPSISLANYSAASGAMNISMASITSHNCFSRIVHGSYTTTETTISTKVLGVTINHNLGTTSYTVALTPLNTDVWTPSSIGFDTKTANSINVIFRTNDGNNGAAPIAFDYIFIQYA